MISENPTAAEFKQVLASLKIYGRCKRCGIPFFQPGLTSLDCLACSDIWKKVERKHGPRLASDIARDVEEGRVLLKTFGDGILLVPIWKDEVARQRANEIEIENLILFLHR